LVPLLLPGGRSCGGGAPFESPDSDSDEQLVFEDLFPGRWCGVRDLRLVSAVASSGSFLSVAAAAVVLVSDDVVVVEGGAPEACCQLVSSWATKWRRRSRY